ncbi:MAG: acylneuraminate cytidylyltransferase [Stygiobacter sp. RIFOXYA2_FULL_38_8]|nr:MAG: acylneuraminate cytidylyltransferase [Stygiobacter sp. RIFOXYA2_FULL_38_8]
MINGKTVLAIIPARGGSKGIPRKNIKMLAGKPLIAWTIEEGKKSKYIDRFILSSEDEEIIKVAKEWGCEVPFIRPKELAQDETPGIVPVIHTINILTEKYDYVCLLQPTSPLRKVWHIDKCIEKCINMETSSCIGVQEVDKHPYLMHKINKLGSLEPLFKKVQLTRRQDADKIYAVNGAIYFAKSDFILNQKSFVGQNTSAFLMDKISSIDIDDMSDFQYADYLLKREKINES